MSCDSVSSDTVPQTNVSPDTESRERDGPASEKQKDLGDFGIEEGKELSSIKEEEQPINQVLMSA